MAVTGDAPDPLGFGDVPHVGLIDLDRLEHGAFVCDIGGTLLAVNAIARRLLAGLIGHERRLCFALAAETKEFARVLEVACHHSAPGDTSTMTCWLAAADTSIVLRAMKLRGASPTSRPRVLVLVERRRGNPRDILRRRFGLTIAEARVAVAVADGVKIDAFCDANGVTPATVRSQLRSIFRKTGTSGQVEFVVLASRL